MYAIIRTGGKQAKVREGDIVDVERLRAEGEVTFTPLLIVDDKGAVISGRDDLKTAKVTARIVGESAGEKIDIFKYKAKTGYRNRGGHRQKYTTIEVLKIEGPKASAPKKEAAAPGDEPAETPVATAAPAAKAAAKPKTAAAKPAAKPGADMPSAAKPAAKKPPVKKPVAGTDEEN